MPKKPNTYTVDGKRQKPNTYTVDGKRQKSWEHACAAAVGRSLDLSDNITIVEKNPNTGATYHITVTAQAERGEQDLDWVFGRDVDE